VARSWLLHRVRFSRLELTFEIKDDKGRVAQLWLCSRAGRYEIWSNVFTGQEVLQRVCLSGATVLLAALAGPKAGIVSAGRRAVVRYADGKKDRMSDYQAMVAELRARAGIRRPRSIWVTPKTSVTKLKYADRRCQPGSG